MPNTIPNLHTCTHTYREGDRHSSFKLEGDYKIMRFPVHQIFAAGHRRGEAAGPGEREKTQDKIVVGKARTRDRKGALSI